MSFKEGYILGGATVVAVGVSFVGGVIFAVEVRARVDEAMKGIQEDAVDKIVPRPWSRKRL